SRRRHTRFSRDWSSDVCSSDLEEPEDKNCEVLVYDNIQQSYSDFINGLPTLFSKYKLGKREFLTETELEKYASIVEKEFFNGCRSEERRVGKECRSRW